MSFFALSKSVADTRKNVRVVECQLITCHDRTRKDHSFIHEKIVDIKNFYIEYISSHKNQIN